MIKGMFPCVLFTGSLSFFCDMAAFLFHQQYGYLKESQIQSKRLNPLREDDFKPLHTNFMLLWFYIQFSYSQILDSILGGVGTVY